MKWLKKFSNKIGAKREAIEIGTEWKLEITA